MQEIPNDVMLRCGILEAYHDKGFEDFYGHPERRDELEPKVKQWNKAHPSDPIKIDFDYGEQVLEQVQQYASNLNNAREHGISLLLWGPNGTGKTLLAAATLKEAIRQGFSSQMTSLGGLIEVYTDGWGDAGKKEIYNRRIRNVDFLFIDDVGKEYKAKSGDLVEVAFDNLIRYRSFRNKPFILTTNTNISNLEGTYGQSLVSLLQGKSIAIKVGGQDYRKLIQAKDLKRKLLGK